MRICPTEVLHVRYTPLQQGSICYSKGRWPKRPEHTVSQFLDWLAGQQRPAMFSRKAMHPEISNFLDTTARQKTSIARPERGVRDHLIMQFSPLLADVNRVALALRQAF